MGRACEVRLLSAAPCDSCGVPPATGYSRAQRPSTTPRPQSLVYKGLLHFNQLWPQFLGQGQEQSSPFLFLAVLTSLQAYLVLLLWYTQKLALRRNLHKKQSLTAIHDQATAWLGLGSAIPVIWDQFSTCVSPLYVACIFLYLAGLFLLGLTMPMLLSIGAVYDHEARYLNITSYLADAGTSAAK